jgi:hypothetical protein
MSTPLESEAIERPEKIDIQERNKRYVQIDAIGVGTAGAAAPFLACIPYPPWCYCCADWVIDLNARIHRVDHGIVGGTLPPTTAECCPLVQPISPAGHFRLCPYRDRSLLRAG